MTTQPRRPGAGFAGYPEAMDAADAPLLGHLVLYSVFEGEVTPGLIGHLGVERLAESPVVAGRRQRSR